MDAAVRLVNQRDEQRGKRLLAVARGTGNQLDEGIARPAPMESRDGVSEASSPVPASGPETKAASGAVTMGPVTRATSSSFGWPGTKCGATMFCEPT